MHYRLRLFLASTLVLGLSVLAAGTAGADPIAIPNAPTNLSATYTQGSSSATLSWSVPTAGNPPDYTYTVASQPASAGCTSVGTLSCTVNGLVAGTEYVFYVDAANIAGIGSSSAASNSVLVTSIPGAVQNLALGNVPGQTDVGLSWGAPTTGYPPVLGYYISYSPGGTTPVETTYLGGVIYNLAPGTTYTFSVTAVNSVGNGPTSTASITIDEVPGAPNNPTAIRYGTGAAQVAWAPPTSGYPTAFSYTVTSSPAGGSCTTTGTSCVVSGLTPGQSYTFSVVASNVAGSGPAAISNVLIVAVGPSAPSRPVFSPLKPGSTTVVLHWAPSPTCGYGCTYALIEGNQTIFTTSSTHIRVAKLRVGVTYTFYVTAQNSNGISGWSAPSKAVSVWFDSGREGWTLRGAQRLWSANHTWHLGVVAGHLSIFSATGKRHWTAPGRAGTIAVLTKTGNLRFMNGRHVVWSSHTSGKGLTIHVVNGHLELVRAGVEIWPVNRTVIYRAPITTSTYPAHTTTTTAPHHTTTTTTTAPPHHTTTTTVPGLPIG